MRKKQSLDKHDENADQDGSTLCSFSRHIGTDLARDENGHHYASLMLIQGQGDAHSAGMQERKDYYK